MIISGNISDYKIKGSEIIEKINCSNSILLLIHKKPDGDAVGSILAMYKYILSINKNVIAFSVDEIGNVFNFLPQINKIEHKKEILLKTRFDLVICMDCGDLNYTGLKGFLNKINYDFEIINIDHHITNSFFGNINLVDENRASTTHILYCLFKTHNIYIDSIMATYLLVGILTDTGNFTNGATDFLAIGAAGQLVNLGARFSKIVRVVQQNKSISILKLWGHIFTRLYINKFFNTALVIITKKDFVKYGVKEDAVDGIANFLNSLLKVDLIFVLREMGDNKIKISLRAKNNSYDVSKLALFFNGGGHKKASGFIVNGSLQFCNNGWKIV